MLESFNILNDEDTHNSFVINSRSIPRAQLLGVRTVDAEYHAGTQPLRHGRDGQRSMRHSGNINGSYDWGHGFTIRTLLFAHTRIPVKPVIGADFQNDGNTVNDRSVINGHVAARDAFRQPGFFNGDLRLLKRFRQFNGDGETTFVSPTATVSSRTGLLFANNTALIPTFAPGTGRFGGPRQVQTGVRLVF